MRVPALQSAADSPVRLNPRSAFSLVELMVVIAVIVILAGLIAGVVVKAIDASRTTASQTTMEVIQSSLTRQLQNVIDASKKGGKSPEEIYALVRQAFPTTINEAKIGFGGNPPYAPYAKNIGPAHMALDAQSQKSALLRLIVEKGPNSKLETDQLSKGALGQVGGVDLILDSWGDPIGIDIQYTGTNATNIKPKFTLSSPNTARGGN